MNPAAMSEWRRVVGRGALRHRALFVGVLVVVGALALAGCGSQSATAKRQADVAQRGAQVMPFDLNATTHTFTKTDSGGVQLITAHDPDDQTQIDLIRQHLQLERDHFAKGDFSDPAKIHGMDMSGVSELSAGYERITVTYSERPAGAELAYATQDATLVGALHSWFDRQVMDHGTSATAG
jgi:hypothetical protein